jgi:hypothetical protein
MASGEVASRPSPEELIKRNECPVKPEHVRRTDEVPEVLKVLAVAADAKASTTEVTEGAAKSRSKARKVSSLTAEAQHVA